MKPCWTFALLWVLLVLGICVTATEERVAAATDEPAGTAAPGVANPAFDKLKTLIGEWETKLPNGKTAVNKVRLTSAGSALLMEGSGEDEMITVLHPDGDRVMATHYCAAKNQPRFVSVPSSDPNVVRFEFEDVTNLSSAGAGHMKGVVFRFADADHHTEEWTWTDGGKDVTETFAFVRKK